MTSKILTISLAASFIGLAVFGFLLMHGSLNSYVGLCIASLGGGTWPCPHGNPAAAYFHMNVFRSFSNLLPAALVIFFAAAFLILNLPQDFKQYKAEFRPALAFWKVLAGTISLFILAAPLGDWLIIRERKAASAI